MRIHINQSTQNLFDLNKVLYAAQDFRWCRRDDGWHSGVLSGNLIHIRQIGRYLEYKCDSDSDIKGLLTTYFRLDEPVDEIHDRISNCDDHIADLVMRYPWLRVLRQPDPWECMVSYICSATNSVKRIRRTVEKIATNLGCEVMLEGDTRHTFPSSEMVLDAGLGRLEEFRMGLDRHRKIMDAAVLMRDGKLNLPYLAQPQVSYDEAKRQLMECYGIGDKIADCICLFALNKTEAFPVDVWVRRAVKRYSNLPTGSNYRAIAEWGWNHFGSYAGYANQFLFYAERQEASPSRSEVLDRCL